MLYQYSGTVVGAASMKNTLRPHFSENNIANTVQCNCHQPSIYKLLEILGVLQLLGIRCLETFCCNSRMEACQEPNAEKKHKHLVKNRNGLFHKTGYTIKVSVITVGILHG